MAQSRQLLYLFISFQVKVHQIGRCHDKIIRRQSSTISHDSKTVKQRSKQLSEMREPNVTRHTVCCGRTSRLHELHSSQNLRLFHVSNLSVLNFRFFLLMYPGSVSTLGPAPRHPLSFCTHIRALCSRIRCVSNTCATYAFLVIFLYSLPDAKMHVTFGMKVNYERQLRHVSPDVTEHATRTPDT